MLPDQADSLVYSITAGINNAKYDVRIFTPLIDDYTMVRSLKKAAKNDVKITLITSESSPQEQSRPSLKNESAYLSLFENISVFTLSSFHHEQDSSSALKGTLVCIDDKELFVITHALSSIRLKEDYAFALHQKTKCKHLFDPLLERARPY